MSDKLKRRSSILKLPKNDAVCIDDENATQRLRRVSFARNRAVKPFAADPHENTIWDRTIEEDAQVDSTRSSEDPSNASRNKQALDVFNTFGIFTTDVYVNDKEDVPAYEYSTMMLTRNLELDEAYQAADSMEITCKSLTDPLNETKYLSNMEVTQISDNDSVSSQEMSLTCQIPGTTSEPDTENLTPTSVSLAAEVNSSLKVRSRAAAIRSPMFYTLSPELKSNSTRLQQRRVLDGTPQIKAKSMQLNTSTRLNNSRKNIFAGVKLKTDNGKRGKSPTRAKTDSPARKLGKRAPLATVTSDLITNEMVGSKPNYMDASAIDKENIPLTTSDIMPNEEQGPEKDYTMATATTVKEYDKDQDPLSGLNFSNFPPTVRVSESSSPEKGLLLTPCTEAAKANKLIQNDSTSPITSQEVAVVISSPSTVKLTVSSEQTTLTINMPSLNVNTALPTNNEPTSQVSVPRTPALSKSFISSTSPTDTSPVPMDISSLAINMSPHAMSEPPFSTNPTPLATNMSPLPMKTSSLPTNTSSLTLDTPSLPTNRSLFPVNMSLLPSSSSPLPISTSSLSINKPSLCTKTSWSTQVHTVSSSHTPSVLSAGNPSAPELSSNNNQLGIYNTRNTILPPQPSLLLSTADPADKSSSNKNQSAICNTAQISFQVPTVLPMATQSAPEVFSSSTQSVVGNRTPIIKTSYQISSRNPISPSQTSSVLSAGAPAAKPFNQNQSAICNTAQILSQVPTAVPVVIQSAPEVSSNSTRSAIGKNTPVIKMSTSQTSSRNRISPSQTSSVLSAGTRAGKPCNKNQSVICNAAQISPQTPKVLPVSTQSAPEVSSSSTRPAMGNHTPVIKMSSSQTSSRNTISPSQTSSVLSAGAPAGKPSFSKNQSAICKTTQLASPACAVFPVASQSAPEVSSRSTQSAISNCTSIRKISRSSSVLPANTQSVVEPLCNNYQSAIATTAPKSPTESSLKPDDGVSSCKKRRIHTPTPKKPISPNSEFIRTFDSATKPTEAAKKLSLRPLNRTYDKSGLNLTHKSTSSTLNTPNFSCTLSPCGDTTETLLRATSKIGRDSMRELDNISGINLVDSLVSEHSVNEIDDQNGENLRQKEEEVQSIIERSGAKGLWNESVLYPRVRSLWSASLLKRQQRDFEREKRLEETEKSLEERTKRLAELKGDFKNCLDEVTRNTRREATVGAPYLPIMIDLDQIEKEADWMVKDVLEAKRLKCAKKLQKFENDEQEILEKLEQLHVAYNMFEESQEARKLQCDGSKIPFKSVSEQIEEAFDRLEEKTWELKELTERSCLLSMKLANFRIDFDQYDCMVERFVTEPKEPINKDNHFARHVQSIFLEKMNEKQLERCLGKPFTVLSWLDYMRMIYSMILQYRNDLRRYEKLECIKMDASFRVTFKLASKINLRILWIITVDLSDLASISRNSVSVETEVGPNKEEQVKNLVDLCPKTCDFFSTFMQELYKYTRSLDM